MGRLRILVLLLSLLALATALAACGSDGGSDESPSTVLESATLEGVSSADLELSLAVRSAGKEETDLDVTLAGPVERKGKELPRLDLTTTIKGSANNENVDFEGGLTLLSSNGFVNYEGTEYEIDPSTFSLAKSSFLATKRKKKNSEPTTYAVNECEEAAASLAVSELGKNLTNDGSADVEGTETTKVSGDLDVPAAIDAVIDLTEEASCDVQLRAAGVDPNELKKARKEITDSVKKAHVEVYVGDDDIVRKLVAELTAEPQGGDLSKLEVEFELSLGKVNENQEIAAPAKSKPVTVLLRKLGVNPLELLSLSSSGGGLSTLLEKFREDAFPALGPLPSLGR